GWPVGAGGSGPARDREGAPGVQHRAQTPAQASGDAHARPADEGAEEVRSAGRAQALPVLEAVVRIPRTRSREGPGDLPGFFWRGPWSAPTTSGSTAASPRCREFWPPGSTPASTP